MSRDVLMSVSIEVNTLGFDPGEGGAVPSRTTKDVKVQFLRSRVNCDNKLNHFTATYLPGLL